jgi:sodium transport system ATP-binding protein
MIETNNLKKVFGKVVAVDGLSFTARNGAITTVLGGNGAGKTTTFRMIGGLIEPDTGTVLIDGVEVGRERVKAVSQLGMLHDEFGLYPRLTAREHLAFAGALHGLGGRQLRHAVERTIDLLDLRALAGRRTVGFSNGERMKVALARTLVHRPKNLILDEPTRGLDVYATRILRDVLRRLKTEGICLVLSSHAMAEVVELSDRVVIIAEGRVHAEGTPSEITECARAADLEAAFVALTTEASAHRSAA